MAKKKSILEQALPQETATVKHDAFDTDTFIQMKNTAKELETAEIEGTKLLKTFPPLAQDVFDALFKYSPELQNVNLMKDSHRINHTLINKAIETPDYQKLRGFTKLDPVNSALATITIAQGLKTVIENELAEEKDLANKLAELEELIKKLQAEHGSLVDISQKAKDPTQKANFKNQASQCQQQLIISQASYKQLIEQQIAVLQGAQQKIRVAARGVCGNAVNQITEMAETLESWGSEAGSIQQLPPETRIKLAKRVAESPKLKALAKMIGRFRRLAIYAQKTKVKHGQDEIYDIEVGNNLQRIIPSELAALTDPLTKKEFMRKFTEGKLMQYSLRGTDKKGKGAIIICVDDSGSMSGIKELWSKATALGLLEIAQMQHRDFACIHFGGENDPLDVTTILKGEKNITEKVIHMSEYFLGGGTDFQTPLDGALKILSAQEFKKADIVFVTDGICDVSDEWLTKFMQEKKALNFRITSILCDVDLKAADMSISKFSDTVETVSNLTLSEHGEDLATEIFTGV